MARRTSRPAKGGSRQAKATSRKKTAAAAAPAQVEVVEEEQSGHIEDGIAVVTAILLIAALLFADAELGMHYGEGLFFK